MIQKYPRSPPTGLRLINEKPDFHQVSKADNSQMLPLMKINTNRVSPAEICFMKKISAHRTSDPKQALALSIVVFLLVGAVSITGLVNPDMYSAATPNWLAQTVGQDAFDLFFVAPLLLIAGLYAYTHNRLAWMIWGGTIAYLVYTFLIYCFCVSFNPLFGVYCAILGLSLFSFIWFVQSSKPGTLNVKNETFKTVTGYYFVAIAVLFSLLWLLEIIPASISGQVPQSVVAAGLPTNPVHVIDLSMFLPSVFILGVGLVRGKKMAIYFAPVALVFFILMDLTIAVLSGILLQQGQDGSIGIIIAMSSLALLSLLLLIWFLRTCTEDISHS